jgi:trans-aconitate methyltransferase
MKWNSQLYDAKHAFVSKLGQGVLDLLAPRHGELILDVGCGTGHLSHEIQLRGANVVGIDNSQEMIDLAKENYPTVNFRLADVTQLTERGEYDAVFSNAVLHWVHRAAEAVKCMSRSLKPDGRFVVEFGGKGNVQRIVSTLQTVVAEKWGIHVTATNYFPSISEYTSILEAHGIEVLQAELFDRPTPLEDGEKGLENWIKMFRRSVLEQIPGTQHAELLDEIANRLQTDLFRDGIWYADYRRLRIVGRKVNT